MIRRYPYSRFRTPQPDRDFAYGQRPQDIAQSHTILGGTGTMAGLGGGLKPPEPYKPLGFGNPIGGGGMGLTQNQLQTQYQNRLDKGWTGDNFLQAHPNFAQQLALKNQAGPNGNQNQPNLPLSPEFEAAHRQLDDALAQQLMAVGVQRDEIPALLAQLNARMDTNQNEDLRQTDESANARGIYNSGIRTDDRGRVKLGYDRQRQDTANTAATQYSALAQQEADARSQYAQDLADLYMQLANQTVGQDNLASPNTASRTAPNTGVKKKKKKKKVGGRDRSGS